MPSKAFNVFNKKKKQEVIEIAEVFTKLNRNRGRNTKYSLLNGALVLLVSSWEVYCEDVCKQAAEKIKDKPNLTFDRLDKQLRSDLIQYAGGQFKGNQDPLLQKVAMLPDGGWRELLVTRFDEYVADFNTPKFSRQRGKDLNGLFRQVLGGGKMSGKIENLYGDADLCGRLDDIVTLRGEIAHTGDARAENKLSPEILKQHVRSFVQAAAAVEMIVYKEFHDKLGFAPWQITEPVKEALGPVSIFS